MKRSSSLLNLFFLLTLVLALLLTSSQAGALEITSTPDYVVHPMEKWEYNITSDNNWVGNLTVETSVEGLVLQDWNLSCLPTDEDIGMYYVNITLHDTIAEVETYDYQNFSLEVAPVAAIGSNYLVLGLVFGFGVIAMGLIDRRWNFLAGIVWLYLALAVFGVFGIPWMVIGLGFGSMLLLSGAMSIADKGG